MLSAVFLAISLNRGNKEARKGLARDEIKSRNIVQDLEKENVGLFFTKIYIYIYIYNFINNVCLL